MNDRISKIRACLTQALTPSLLEIIDESAKHIGHAGAQGGAGHYALIISSSQFNPNTQIDNHRLIYKALDGLIPKEIHALSIDIKY